MKKIGYVLSGGGARGFAHLGILKYLEELNIKADAISGTSIGAIIGVLYAAGKSAETILEIMKGKSLFGWTNILWNKPGFFSMDVLEDLLKSNIERDDFNALKIKLFIAATDLNKGETIIFSEGKLFRSVIASASVPVIFEPVVIDQRRLVDGGLLNNFPVEPLQNICDVIIGSHVNKIEEGIWKRTGIETLNIVERCFHLAISTSVYSKRNLCDLFIEPSLYLYDMFNVKKADEIFEIGYNEARQYKEKLEKIAF